MEKYRRRTAQRMTYKRLAELTGLAQGTLEVMGRRLGYNATLATIERICRALDLQLDDVVELIDDPPKKRPKAKSKKRKKRR